MVAITDEIMRVSQLLGARNSAAPKCLRVRLYVCLSFCVSILVSAYVALVAFVCICVCPALCLTFSVSISFSFTISFTKLQRQVYMQKQRCCFIRLRVCLSDSKSLQSRCLHQCYLQIESQLTQLTQLVCCLHLSVCLSRDIQTNRQIDIQNCYCVFYVTISL